MEQETKEIKEIKALTVTQDYAVNVTMKEGLTAFFADGKNLEELYAGIEKTARGLVADPLTKEGASQIKGCARQLASLKKKIDDIGKDVVAELKDLPKKIDANRKKFRDSMEALQDDIRRPVTEIENREDEIEGIKNTHVRLAGADSDTLKAEIESIRAIPLTEEKWHESLENAKAAIEGEAKALALLMDAALKREAEARELEELRKKQEEAERIISEQKIKEEAARKAKEEADARAAAEKARLQREKEEAERRAAEAESKAQEAKERAELAEMEKRAVKSKNGNALDDRKVPHSTVSSHSTASRPSAWTQEQKDVNNAVVAAIAAILPQHLAGFTDNGYELAAKAVVKAVLTGKIAHLKVEY